MLYAMLVITNFLLTVCMCIFLNMVKHRNKVIEFLLESMHKDNVRVLPLKSQSSHPYDYQMEEDFQRIIDDFED